MTVEELRKELDKWPDKAEVYVWDFGQGGIVPAEVDEESSNSTTLTFGPKDSL